MLWPDFCPPRLWLALLAILSPAFLPAEPHFCCSARPIGAQSSIGGGSEGIRPMISISPDLRIGVMRFIFGVQFIDSRAALSPREQHGPTIPFKDGLGDGFGNGGTSDERQPRGRRYGERRAEPSRISGIEACGLGDSPSMCGRDVLDDCGVAR